MRIRIIILATVAVIALTGCSAVTDPEVSSADQEDSGWVGSDKAEADPEVALSELDFSNVKYQILTEEHPRDQIFIITYIEIDDRKIVTELSPAENPDAPVSDSEDLSQIFRRKGQYGRHHGAGELG